MTSPRKGARKPSFFDNSCILGIQCVTAWRCCSLDSKPFICIFVVCKDSTGVNYAEVPHNLVILGSLATRYEERENECALHHGENPFYRVEYKVERNPSYKAVSSKTKGPLRTRVLFSPFTIWFFQTG